MEMSAVNLTEEIKILATRMIDCFLPKFRIFVTEKLKEVCGDQDFVK